MTLKEFLQHSKESRGVLGSRARKQAGRQAGRKLSRKGRKEAS